MECNNKKILILKQSSLGDIIHTLPVVHALKRCFPSCSIGWVVQKELAPLVSCDPDVDDVHVIDIPSTSEPGKSRSVWWQAALSTVSTLFNLRRAYVAKPYDLILDLHASFRSGLLGWANPGGMRLGFSDARELNTFFQDRLITVPGHVEHAVDKNLLFCTHLGCRVDRKDFHLHCNDKDSAMVDSFLQQQGVQTGDVLVYANPCARWQTKFWPVESWATLADLLHEDGITLVFAGSIHDREYIKQISERMRAGAVVTAGKLGLPQSIALLRRSRAYVGLDSGPMHMAAMNGTPVAALFGPTHPERVGPYGVRNVIIRNETLECLGCRKRHCDHQSCMRGITVDQVRTGLLSLLNSRVGLDANGDLADVHAEAPDLEKNLDKSPCESA